MLSRFIGGRSIVRPSRFLLSSARLDSTDVLPYQEIKHNSVEMLVDTLPVNDTSEFSTRLWTTIASLRKKGKKAIFLNIGALYSHYIPIAGMFGFRYHHAIGDTATLLLWLPESECKVPSYATHHCGVAGAIIKDNKLLVVKDYGKASGWKLPGGYVNQGEEFGDAAIREVFEETGIKSTFNSILTIRHSHNIQFNCDDIYIICKLSPLSTTITIDPEEIQSAEWMSISDFKSANKHPMLEVAINLLEQDVKGLEESTMESTVPGRKPFKLYHPK